jgi:signal transduction histidine kinase
MTIGKRVRSSLGRMSRASIELVCAAFSVLVLVLCVLEGLHFKNKIDTEYYRQTANIAQILMVDFDNDAATADAILARLAAEIPESSVSQSNQLELHRLLQRYVLHPSMIGPAILDREGRLIASATVYPAPEMSLRERNTFRVQAAGTTPSGLYISVPLQGVLAKEPEIQFSRPLRDPSGAFYGVVLLSYRLSYFVKLYEKLELSDHGLASLTGKDGVVRVRTLNGAIEYGAAVSRMPLVYQRVIAGENSGTFDTRSGIDNVKRIGSFVVSPTMPFFVAVGYGTDYLRGQFIGYFYALGLCWLVLTAAMAAAAVFIDRLGKLGQQAQLDVVNSALAERRKIAADMHDSIGASLASLLAYFTVENVNLVEVKRRIADMLIELRLLVDSIETDGSDINMLLGNVRHRMASGLELAGIDLHWDVEDLPQIDGLTERDALAIKLVLMEALSNVLHHANAANVTLTARCEGDSTIAIAVADDGRGFDAGGAGAGRGLANMRKRMATVSTGGALSIDSTPARGTTVRLVLNVPPSR